MEIKHYLHILLRHWKLILLSILVTVIPTIVLVSRQPWIYEADATFIIRPRASFGENQEEFVDAVDTLSRRVEINTTFAEVASSSLIKQRAVEALDLSSKERRGLKVKGDVIAGTNILQITVEGRSPVVVSNFANAASEETVAYVKDLYDVFELEPLDEATIPSRPSGPNKMFTIILGAIFGLLLGVGLAFLIEYLRKPLIEELEFNIVDIETGVYNRAYFLLRLQEEISRARHSNYAFSLALIRLDERDLFDNKSRPVPPDLTANLITTIVESDLREEDILAHLGSSIFALLMPGQSEKESLALLGGLPGKIETKTIEKPKSLLARLPRQFEAAKKEIRPERENTMAGLVGIIEYQQDDKTVEALIGRATKALEKSDFEIQDSMVIQVDLTKDVTNGTNGHHPSEREERPAITQLKRLAEKVTG